MFLADKRVELRVVRRRFPISIHLVDVVPSDFSVIMVTKVEQKKYANGEGKNRVGVTAVYAFV